MFSCMHEGAWNMHSCLALCVNSAVLSMLHKAWSSHTFLCQTSRNLVLISRLWQKCLLQTNQLILSDLRILFWEARFWACLSFQSQILTAKTQKVLLNNSYRLGHPRYLRNISISKASLGFSSVLYWGTRSRLRPWTRWISPSLELTQAMGSWCRYTAVDDVLGNMTYL